MWINILLKRLWGGANVASSPGPTQLFSTLLVDARANVGLHRVNCRVQTIVSNRGHIHLQSESNQEEYGA